MHKHISVIVTAPKLEAFTQAGLFEVTLGTGSLQMEKQMIKPALQGVRLIVHTSSQKKLREGEHFFYIYNSRKLVKKENIPPSELNQKSCLITQNF